MQKTFWNSLSLYSKRWSIITKRTSVVYELELVSLLLKSFPTWKGMNTGPVVAGVIGKKKWAYGAFVFCCLYLLFLKQTCGEIALILQVGLRALVFLIVFKQAPHQ